MQNENNKMNGWQFLNSNPQVIWYTLFGLFVFIFFGMIIFAAKVL